MLVLCARKALRALRMDGARLHVPQAAVHAMRAGHCKGLMLPSPLEELGEGHWGNEQAWEGAS